MFTLPALPLTLALGVLVGKVVAAYVVGQRTLLQTSVAEGYLGRVTGALSTSQSIALLVGMGVASALGTPLGAPAVLDVAAGCYLLAGFVALLLLPSRRGAPSRVCDGHGAQVRHAVPGQGTVLAVLWLPGERGRHHHRATPRTRPRHGPMLTRHRQYAGPLPIAL